MMNEPISFSTIEMLIHSMPLHAILKDAKSGKCLDINQSHLSVYGFSKPSDMQGNTVWDVNNFMSQMWLDNARQVEQFDAEVLHTRKPLIKPMRIWLNSQGQVWAHYMSKVPIIGSNGNVIGILGTSQDLTNTLTLSELYQQYCNFYIDRKNAIKLFLGHINMSQFFHTLPSHAETMVLISKKTLLTNKAIAHYLKISEGTVENHINHLCDKLYSRPTQLKQLLENMDII